LEKQQKFPQDMMSAQAHQMIHKHCVLLAGAGILWKEITASWLVLEADAGMLWEENTVGWCWSRTAEQSENLPELLSTRIKQSKRGKKVQWWLVDSIEMVKLWLSSGTGSAMWRKYKVFQPQISPGSQIVKQATWTKATEDTNNVKAKIDIDMGNESSTPHALPS